MLLELITLTILSFLIHKISHHLMKKFISICFATCFILPVSAQDNGALHLTSGEKLPAYPTALNDNHLQIQSDYLNGHGEIPLKAVDQIIFDSTKLNIPEKYSIIELKNGDNIHGTLLDLSTEKAILQTPWEKELVIERPFVSYVGFEAPTSCYMDMTESLSGWNQENNFMLPQAKLGKFVFPNRSTCAIKRPLELPSRIHLQFTLQHTLSYSLEIHLWKNESKSPHRLVLSLSSTSLQVTSTKNGRYENIGRFRPEVKQNWYSDNNLIQSKIDFYADKDNGVFALAINGKRIGVWTHDLNNSDNGSKTSFMPGNIFYLRGRDIQDMKLSNLNITEWNGSPPKDSMENDTLAPVDTDSKQDKVLLVNGDVLRGTLSLEKEGYVRVKSKHYDVRVPSHRVKELQQNYHSSDIANQSLNADIRLELADMSKISIRLLDINEDKIKAQLPCSKKEVFIPLKLVKKIIFNLNDAELKKLRD